MFRILDCVDALNEKMGLRLTHHDVNWCYNLQYLKGKSYYIKARMTRFGSFNVSLSLAKGYIKTFSSCQGRGTTAFLAQLKKGHQVGH